MNMSDMKNMIVLKNLPSNLIEEAIIVLKENKKIHKYQMIDIKNENNEKDVKDVKREKAIEKNAKDIKKECNQDSSYIVKEAEMLVKSYTENLEKKSPKWKNNMKKLEKRYKLSLKINFLLMFTTILGLVFSLI